MKEELPLDPLKPTQFARAMSLAMHRLIRVANQMDPPLTLEKGRIPVSEYPRLYELLKNEPVTIMPSDNAVKPEEKANIG
ncbi:MAG: hypothetical protein Q7T54_01080 [Candidatus Levybacteria bacterium]|nr:hypothetical protein [Candidatus Levybacteria bacterium]